MIGWLGLHFINMAESTLSFIQSNIGSSWRRKESLKSEQLQEAGVIIWKISYS